MSIYSDSDKSVVAGKTVSKFIFKHWEQEKDNLRNIGNEHKNVVRYIPPPDEDEQHITLYMELCDGNLEQYIHNKSFIPQKCEDQAKILAQNYFRCSILDLLEQTALGLKYLHDNNIIHRDLKPSNVLLIRTKQDKVVAKLSDFGLSKELPKDSSTSHTSTASTTAYMAKECYDNIWKRHSDMFAFGILCYYALTKGREDKHPFGEESYQIEGNIRKEKPPKFNELRENSKLPYSKEERITMVDMIKRLVCHKRQKRLTVEAVLVHPTFYTPEKKLEFLDIIDQQLDMKKDITTDAKFKLYDKGLENDDQAGQLGEFNIHEDNLPSYFRSNISKIDGKPYPRWHPEPKLRKNQTIESWRTVKNWLRVLRNKDEHACDAGNLPEFYDQFDVNLNKSSYNRKKLLQVFLEPHPPLLVHLYEFFRNKIQNNKFYPIQTVPSAVEHNQTQTESTKRAEKKGCTETGKLP